MTSHWRCLTTPRSLLALGTGLGAFMALSVVRIHLQHSLGPSDTLGFLLTSLMYLIAGAVVGLLAQPLRLSHGVILGLLAAVVGWFEAPLHASMPWAAILQFVAVFGLFGAVFSAAGSLAAHWAVQHVTSNNRWRGP
jgi:hypothetical protein